MELADPRMIAELLATHARTVRGRAGQKKPPVLAKATNAASTKAKRCHCGQCVRCQENARWDRIFNERFADPNYYKERPARFGSSMGWLATGNSAS